MQLGLDVLPDGPAPPGTGGLSAPVAGLNFLAWTFRTPGSAAVADAVAARRGVSSGVHAGTANNGLTSGVC